MSTEQGPNRSRHQHKDWWGKRPLTGLTVSERSKTMKWWKRRLHKIERQQARREVTVDEG